MAIVGQIMVQIAHLVAFWRHKHAVATLTFGNRTLPAKTGVKLFETVSPFYHVAFALYWELFYHNEIFQFIFLSPSKRRFFLS